MLDLRRMKILREVALHGTISAAAKALSVTPSAVSQQIASLEREARVPLLERTPRSVRLTDAGRALVDPPRRFSHAWPRRSSSSRRSPVVAEGAFASRPFRLPPRRSYRRRSPASRPAIPRSTSGSRRVTRSTASHPSGQVRSRSPSSGSTTSFRSSRTRQSRAFPSWTTPSTCSSAPGIQSRACGRSPSPSSPERPGSTRPLVPRAIPS